LQVLSKIGSIDQQRGYKSRFGFGQKSNHVALQGGIRRKGMGSEGGKRCKDEEGASKDAKGKRGFNILRSLKNTYESRNSKLNEKEAEAKGYGGAEAGARMNISSKATEGDGSSKWVSKLRSARTAAKTSQRCPGGCSVQCHSCSAWCVCVQCAVHGVQCISCSASVAVKLREEVLLWN
jgi:hypothetical protein